MATFDDLYGAGSYNILVTNIMAAVPTATPSQAATVDGSVHLEVAWSNHNLKLDCFPDHVHFSYLSTVCGPPTIRLVNPAIYSAFCSRLPQFFKNRGVSYFTALPLEPVSMATLVKYGGFITNHDGLLEWIL